MKLFDVYPLWNIEPVKGQGCRIWDKEGVEYLDLYGGHAVISIGHCHPKYNERLKNQIERLGFYSNAVQNGLQKELAEKLGQMCGYPTYNLFLCNSGAEANENAFKVASFHTGRKRILAISKAFHGRTSGAVEATDNPKIQAEFNKNNKSLRQICDATGTVLILDEIQSGYGRTGKFFAHQHCGVEADIVTVAKGIGNGFPLSGVIISPKIEAVYGMLGTTFGGNHLACTAAIAVLDVMKEEKLVENAAEIGEYLIERLKGHKAIKELRGKGLMIGIELNEGFSTLRNRLLFEKHIFTGGAGANVIRLLPPLCITKEIADQFIEALTELENE